MISILEQPGLMYGSTRCRMDMELGHLPINGAYNLSFLISYILFGYIRDINAILVGYNRYIYKDILSKYEVINPGILEDMFPPAYKNHITEFF